MRRNTERIFELAAPRLRFSSWTREFEPSTKAIS
jgi:hypothetical protein